MENNTIDKIQVKNTQQFLFYSLEIQPLEHEINGNKNKYKKLHIKYFSFILISFILRFYQIIK